MLAFVDTHCTSQRLVDAAVVSFVNSIFGLMFPVNRQAVSRGVNAVGNRKEADALDSPPTENREASYTRRSLC
jgi:hypothetical protein